MSLSYLPLHRRRWSREKVKEHLEKSEVVFAQFYEEDAVLFIHLSAKYHFRTLSTLQYGGGRQKRDFDPFQGHHIREFSTNKAT